MTSNGIEAPTLPYLAKIFTPVVNDLLALVRFTSDTNELVLIAQMFSSIEVVRFDGAGAGSKEVLQAATRGYVAKVIRK